MRCLDAAHACSRSSGVIGFDRAPHTVFWGGRSGTVKKVGKHGVVVEVEDNSHKLFWDEVESVKKAGKHGETTGKPAAAWKPSEPGLVDPTASTPDTHLGPPPPRSHSTARVWSCRRTRRSESGRCIARPSRS